VISYAKGYEPRRRRFPRLFFGKQAIDQVKQADVAVVVAGRRTPGRIGEGKGPGRP